MRQWRLEDGTLVEAAPFALNGEFLSASGDTVYLQNGQSIFAYMLEADLSLSVLGVAINETVIQAAVDRGCGTICA